MRRYCVLYATVLLSLGPSHLLTAQVPAGSAPPTYGQTVLSSYDARFVRQAQLIFTLVVPSGALQNLLPPGYKVLPGDTATVTASFSLQQRDVVPNPIGNLAKGTYGPASAMIIQVEAIDPDGDYEQLQLENERSTDASVSLVDALWGEGSARRASSLTIDLKEVTREQEDNYHADAAKEPFIRFSGRVENEVIGLVLGVHATVPAAVTTAVRNSVTKGPDGNPEPSRFINGFAHPPVANTAVFQVVNDDRVTVPSAHHLDIEVPDHELRLSEGNLPILGVGPTVTLVRVRESFQLKCNPTICP